MDSAHQFMGRSLEQLRAQFVANPMDLDVLEALEHELHYRQTPQALALLIEVRGAMRRAAPVGHAVS